jgi:hypothetical protein
MTTTKRDPKSGKFTPSPTPGVVAADVISDVTDPVVEAVGTQWSFRGVDDALVGYLTAVAWQPPETPESEPLTSAVCPLCRHEYWSLDTICTGVLTEDRTEVVDHEPALVQLAVS